MKTAIPLPDDLFERAEAYAKEHGCSRSELFAAAMREFLEEHRRADLTERLDRVCEEVETYLPQDVAQAAKKRMRESEW